MILNKASLHEPSSYPIPQGCFQYKVKNLPTTQREFRLATFHATDSRFVLCSEAKSMFTGSSVA